MDKRVIIILVIAAFFIGRLIGVNEVTTEPANTHKIDSLQRANDSLNFFAIEHEKKSDSILQQLKVIQKKVALLRNTPIQRSDFSGLNDIGLDSAWSRYNKTHRAVN